MGSEVQSKQQPLNQQFNYTRLLINNVEINQMLLLNKKALKFTKIPKQINSFVIIYNKD